MKKKRKKINNKKDKVSKSHIKKISQVAHTEDLFILSSNLDKKNFEKLTKQIEIEIKKEKVNLDKEIIKRLKKTKDPIEIKDALVSKLIEELTDKYEQIMEKISEKRKQGVDTFLYELKLMSMQYKLNLFKATKDKKDYLIIKKLIKEVEDIMN